MTRFERVKEILDKAINNETIGMHGAFWRNVTRDKFVSLSIFGKQLVRLGNGGASNIIHALKGQAPFGSDIGTPGAIYPRMPVGFPAVPAEDIQFIEQWINDNCPEDPWPPAIAKPQGLQTPQEINDYFRELDNWSMFHRTPEVNTAIEAFFTAADSWFQVATGILPESAWTAAFSKADVREAVSILGPKQKDTATRFFGNPLNWAKLSEAYEKFGDDSLPADPFRPSRKHQMDGEVMWFFWLAFAETAIALGEDGKFWNLFARGILVGLYNDGVFRQRFNVQGFSRDATGKAAMRDYAAKLPDTDLKLEARRRFAQSGIGQ